MLFKELQILTGNRCTHAQYETINRIYMDCNHMTHEDAAKIWEMTYGITPEEELDMEACVKIAVALAWLMAGDDLEKMSRSLSKALNSLGVTVVPICRAQ